MKKYDVLNIGIIVADMPVKLPVSVLDFKTDAALRSALKKETANETFIIVAQRISTIMQADKIIVVDEGKIVGMGRHDELLKSTPEYREIAESQLSASELLEEA